MVELFFLKEEEIWGVNALGIFDKLEQGRKAVLTDFARCMGAHIDDISGYGYYWTQSDDGNGNVHVVLINGSEGYGTIDDIGIGGRPAVKYSDLLDNVPYGIFGETPEGVDTFMAGTWLQKKVSNEMSQKLTLMLEAGKLPIMEDEHIEIDYPFLKDMRFDMLELPRYTLRGRQYTRFQIFGPDGDGVQMSDGSFAEFANDYWFEWLPIIWLIDEEKDIAISQDILFTGIAINTSETYDGNFEKTRMGHFLRALSKEIRLEKDFILNYAYDSKGKTGFRLNKILGKNKKY